MNEKSELPAWREELSAIVGARAHGQSKEILPRLKALDARNPNIAEINYQLAWSYDVLAHGGDALPYYEKAIALGLSPNELSGALLGLGSTLRTQGQPARAAEVLRSGKTQFPENREFDVYLAFALHDLGQHTAALKLLIETLCDTTEDPGLTAYQRAIRYAAENL